MRYLSITIVVALLGLAALPAAGVAAPTCDEGPKTEGNTITGTPCADTIRLPRSVTIVYGEEGDDILYGQRGNDRLFGGEGNDRLYGGVGDDRLRGGEGNDLLSGGFGADSLDGEAGDDIARGDATIDSIGDSGGGTDTLSFATGATPGFLNPPASDAFFADAGFPAAPEGRGVFVDLGDDFANNGLAPSGGGVDKPLEPATDFSDFETVIGTAFADYIVGTDGTETFHGGGGGDLIAGGGGGDTAYGGAGEDGCVEVASEDCESNSEQTGPGNPGVIAVGVMAAPTTGAPALYMTGSSSDDAVTATFLPGSTGPDSVVFTRAAGSVGGFDPNPAAGCDQPAEDKVVCPLPGPPEEITPPDSILLAGREGDDTLTAAGFPDTVSVVLLGNEDGDHLTGGETEDALVDGAGADVVVAGGRDDALPNNGGADQLDAGPGEDLFISNAVCDGDVLDGGADRDNANWANFGSGIAIDMEQETAGLTGGGQPSCPSESLFSKLQAIEDIEGSNNDDNLIGDALPNQILGRKGTDAYVAGGGNDFLLANSGDSDALLDCGEGDADEVLIDEPGDAYADPVPTGCEFVEEREPDSFRPPNTPSDPDPDPDPEPEPEPEPEGPGPSSGSETGPAVISGSPLPVRPLRSTVDLQAPRTAILRRPARLLFATGLRRRVAFFFAANETARFRCKLDRRPIRRCRSPRSYFVGPGRHLFRVFAIDEAGNRDRSPAVVRFRVRRR